MFAAAAAAASAAAGSNAGGGTTPSGQPPSNDHQPLVVTVFEAGSQTLTKVKISGGGRCNVLHDASKPVPQYLQGYPRGKQALNGLLTRRFGPQQAHDWFMQRGVTLKTEHDGRMFPTTDSSQTVIDALLGEARERGVHVQTRAKVESVVRRVEASMPHEDDSSSSSGNGEGPVGPFQITVKRAESGTTTTTTEFFDAVILATGSAPFGYRIAQSLGHNIVDPMPSLFTLSTSSDVQEGGLLHGLAGVSVPWARVSLCRGASTPPPTAEEGPVASPKKRRSKNRVAPESLMQEGPLLITHHGLSGPAALRLSAYGAREMGADKYRGNLTVHWAPGLGTVDQIFEALWLVTQRQPRKTVRTVCPLTLPVSMGSTSDPSTSLSSSPPVVSAIPKRLWGALTDACGFADSLTWGAAPKKAVRQLASRVAECPLTLTGKGTFKEEFVTAGGVDLNEIDMRTMQSKRCPGLFLCGEVIDVDGVTGGFNFMNCWYATRLRCSHVQWRRMLTTLPYSMSSLGAPGLSLEKVRRHTPAPGKGIKTKKARPPPFRTIYV